MIFARVGGWWLAGAVLMLAWAGVAAALDGAGEIRVVLAGDSTVTDSDGWGPGFAGAFDDRVAVTNLAKGGRSSKSFRDEGWWDRVLEQRPDVVLIQFGHNDQPGKGPERETKPQTTFRQNLERYVREVREAGAEAVLVTSLARRRWAGPKTWKPSGVEPYAQATREVAAELGVVLIDLHARSIEVYESLGEDAVRELSPRSKEGKYDRTHLNGWGGLYMGMLVADALRRQMPALNEHWRWNGNRFPDPREGKASQRDLTTGMGGPATPKGEATLRVAADGSGEFLTVQEAVAAAADLNADRTVIDIAPGVYVGPVVVGPDKINLTFRGHGRGRTVLTYGLNVNAPLSDDQGYLFNGCGVTVLGDGFAAERLTFRNTSGDFGQAMALRLQADRVVIRDCELLGWQDTLLVHSGRHYFAGCHIEGRVDFIYGGATAVFDRCTIKSKRGGYITAANTPEDQSAGLVFLDCQLVSDDATPTYLGRPWRAFASVTFVRCEMGDHIRPEGWENWRDPAKEATARFAEFDSRGPGAAAEQRVRWSRQLTADEVKRFELPGVLRGSDGWEPASSAAGR